MCLSKEFFLSVMNVSQPNRDDGSSRITGLSGTVHRFGVNGLHPTSFGEVRKKGARWTDTQIVMSLVLLNIAGGDSV